MGIKIGNLDISFKVGSGDCTVYLGSEKLYPQEEPTFDGKFQAWYSDSTTYSAECDSSSALTTSDTRAHTTSYTAMTSAEVGDCVTSIGGQIFEGCGQLTSVTIPNSVTSIGNAAFNGCSSLTNIEIPSGLTSIGDYTFRGCSGLTSIDIPSGVTSIGSWSFYGCSSLSSVTIGNGVTSIGYYTFYNCNSLTSITIPSGVTSIGDSAFMNCTSLTSIDIPNSVTRIDPQAFNGCISLTSITIPNSVTSIGNKLFQNCVSLTSIEIPSGVTSIGNNAFYNCDSLTSIIVNATTPPTLGTTAFALTNSCPIYVPCESVENYKTAWSDYASRIDCVQPTPTAQTPCYAVVNDITQYSDTDFEDVFNNADDKWYKLNNLDEYEEYGIYASGRTECGSTPSRLPSGYTEVEYIENTGTSATNGAYINTGVLLYDDANNTFTITSRLKSQSYSASGDDTLQTIINSEGVSSPYNGFVYRYKYRTTSEQLELAGNNNNASLTTVDNEDGTRTITIQTVSAATFTEQVPLSIFSSFNGNYSTPYRFSKTTLYSMTVVKNGTTVRDFVPAQRDSDSKYGLYDLITSTFYVSPNGNNFVGGSAVTPSQECVTTYEGKLTVDDDYEYQYSGGTWNNVGKVSGSTEYPIYYETKQDPPTSVTFATMEEALQYQCPYVGLHATIGGEEYVFNEQYQWELVPVSTVSALTSNFNRSLPITQCIVDITDPQGIGYYFITFSTTPNYTGSTASITNYSLCPDEGTYRINGTVYQLSSLPQAEGYSSNWRLLDWGGTVYFAGGEMYAPFNQVYVQYVD